ncbi:hypothetical protein [Helicobacter sp. 11S02629-2]|uniref:hypothetical protein n=1 Tax=Helicobacter sp. 11S02629-2 TaxID=1476195 RepID=UPI000BA6D35D|nr:hypothetical protein [Helicobacter sp. 11S02629-2]PAF45965.1 hypothetical protein BKH40_00710 [Helicobacter sp. 11S02629-2]
MKQITKKATRIILATSLIASLSSMAMAATHKRVHHTNARQAFSANNNIEGIKFLLGGGVGTGLNVEGASRGFSVLAPNAGLDAKLKLGTGIFSATRSGTIGLQATIGVGANALGSGTGFNPQYSVNLDFIQAFNVGSGYVKLGYILGAGLAIRTHDAGSNRSGNHISDSVVGAASINVMNILVDQRLDGGGGGGGGGGTTPSPQSTTGVSGSGAGGAVMRVSGLNMFNDTVGNTSTLPSVIIASSGASGGQADVNMVGISETYNDSIKAMINAIGNLQQGNFLAARVNAANAQSLAASIDQFVSGGAGNGKAIYGVSNDVVNQRKKDLESMLSSYSSSSGYTPSSYGLLKDLQATANSLASFVSTYTSNKARDLANQASNLQETVNNLQPKANKLSSLQQQVDTIPGLQANANKVDDLTKKLSDLTSSNQLTQEDLTAAQESFNKLTKVTGDLQQQIKDAQDQITALIAQRGTTGKQQDTDIAAALDKAKNLTGQLADINQQLAEARKKIDDYRNQQIVAANQANAAERQRQALKDSIPPVLPTLKAGLIAFIGKHQAVSLEYQYYFRNTSSSFASSDISLNYTYYFGSK